ncbi:MAG: HdeD family acid-resistance protein [Bdellovibrio sp.]
MSFVYLQRHIQEHWKKIVLVGSVYLALGFLAIVFSGIATLAAVTLLAVSLVVVGVFELIFSFQTRKEGRFWYHIFFGGLAVLCGAFIFSAPIVNMMAITLTAAVFLLARGITQAIISVYERYPYWGWSFGAAAIDIILGGTILYSWPLSSFWMIGIFIGVSLMMYGGQLIGLAAVGRRVTRFQPREASKPSETRPTPKEGPRDQDTQRFL